MLYATILPNLRNNFLGSIEKLGLRRNLQISKNTYKIVLKGSMNTKLQNVFQFGVLPSSIVLYMCKSASVYGNYKDTSVFEHFDVQTIALFINGNYVLFILGFILLVFFGPLYKM